MATKKRFEDRIEDARRTGVRSVMGEEDVLEVKLPSPVNLTPTPQEASAGLATVAGRVNAPPPSNPPTPQEAALGLGLVTGRPPRTILPSVPSRLGVTQPTVALPKVVVSPAPKVGRETVATMVVPEQRAGPIERKPLHERFATPREALRGMDDDEFKTFVDEHRHIPGLGYVENKEGRIERVIPSTAQAKQPDLNVEQIQVMTGLINARNQGRQAAASEARLGVEGRRVDIAEKHNADVLALNVRKLEHEIAKTDFNDPVQRLKTFRELAIAGGGKRFILDENQMRIGEENVPDWEGAAETHFKTLGLKPPYMPPKKAEAMTTLPPAEQHTGRIIRGSDGTRLQSDGKTWNPVR